MRAVSRIAILVIIASVSVGVYCVRLHIDETRMRDLPTQNLITSSAEYRTRLTVFDDPETKNYITTLAAKDEVINHRVLVKSTALTHMRLAALQVGDSVEVTGYLQELGPYQQYKNREHIVSIFVVQQIHSHSTTTSLIHITTTKARSAISSVCVRLRTQQGLCEGLLIGEKNHIAKKTYDTFKEAQLTHLIVASGANIALLLRFLTPLLSRLRLRSANIIIIGVALFYCFITRFEPSMVRASMMVIIPSMVAMRGYRISAPVVFAATIYVCALADPFLLFRVGFWLSATATAGLIFLSPVFARTIKIPLVCDTLAATIMTIPVLSAVFGFTLSLRWWISVIAIAVAAPLTIIGFILVATCIILGEGFVSNVLLDLYHMGLRVLEVTAQLGAQDFSLYAGVGVTALVILSYTRKSVGLSRRANGA